MQGSLPAYFLSSSLNTWRATNPSPKRHLLQGDHRERDHLSQKIIIYLPFTLEGWEISPHSLCFEIHLAFSLNNTFFRFTSVDILKM
jgi:hypothetical protein